MQLKNKTAVIFGGSGAIGSAAAYALAREGAHASFELLVVPVLPPMSWVCSENPRICVIAVA